VEDMNIGLALSGGGVRAAVFHLGMLKRLAERGLMERVSDISTVSGASLIVGLIFSQHRLAWPTSREFLTQTLPAAKRMLTEKDLQLRSILMLLGHPWWLRNRAMVLAKEIHAYWGVKGQVHALPENPNWIINATTFETGQNFRFNREYMGDAVCGFVKKPNVALSAAMASSASLPFLIGPYALRTGRHAWFRTRSAMGQRGGALLKPQYRRLHLWDGGVYENLGVDALFAHNALQEGIDHIIVSDASAIIGNKRRCNVLQIVNLLRLINIATDQVRSLRARDVQEFLESNPEAGLYIKMGRTACEAMGGRAGYELRIDGYLDDAKVERVKHFKTTLRRLTPEDFDLILRHGYEATRIAEVCQRAQVRRQSIRRVIDAKTTAT
jgi:NTE family protein